MSSREQELWKLKRFLGENTVKQLIEMGFTTAPASTHFHGCYEGGLFDHSMAMLKRLIELSRKNRLKWRRIRSPYVVAIMHDLCKVDQYRKNDDPNGYPYVYVDTEVKGHGEKSVLYAKRLINMTEEEENCIRYHMGAFMQDDIEAFTKSAKVYPIVLYTHLADMIASQIDEM